MKKIRIGSGAGYGGDRVEPAIEIMRKGNVDYIVFECLAERTIALAHEQMLKDPDKGYNELLEYRMERVLPLCKEKGIRIITNMGAANPVSAAKVTARLAQALGVHGLKIAAVTGDDVHDLLPKYLNNEVLETGKKLVELKDKIVSANAYIGVDGILKALEEGADIVIAGRVADPALFLAPIRYEFGWNPDDYDRIGKGILAGHMLECSSQVTGGYFADPGYKDVPELWNIGFPIAEISENGDFIITKLEDAGGMVTPATCKEQIVYEIHDPSNYFTPDGIADYSGISVEEIGKDCVRVTGATGRRGNGLYKVSVGYKDCYIGEGEISYGGLGAYERAKLAGDIIQKRLEYRGIEIEELRIDFIGINSLFKEPLSTDLHGGSSFENEVRLRVAARTLSWAMAEQIGNEVEALYLNGPAGGGGARKYVRDIVSVASIFIPKDEIDINVVYEEV